MVALPGQLFYSTQIPACLWFLARDKRRSPSPARAGEGRGEGRDRRGEVLFIDARKLGQLVDRTHRELTGDEVARIANTYHAWRSPAEALAKAGAAPYEDIPGFRKSARLEEIRKHGHVLTPGRYVGAEAQEDDGEPFEEKMKRFVAALKEQQGQAAKLDATIAANLKELGYGE
jgi:type I restriction enzyme M protein